MVIDKKYNEKWFIPNDEVFLKLYRILEKLKKMIRSRGYKTFFMLNSTEHEISHANEY